LAALILVTRLDPLIVMSSFDPIAIIIHCRTS
jgi:hypothetical protein